MNLRIATVLLLALSLGGCVTGWNAPAREVTVMIDYGPVGAPVTQTVDITGFPTLLDVMRQVALIQTYRSVTGDVYITSINGISNNQPGIFWTYTVNGHEPLLAPNEQVLRPGDHVKFYAQ